MTNNYQSTATPTLRFPEFRGGEQWKTAPLGAIAERVSTKNTDGSVTRVLTNSAERGVLDQRDYFDRDIATAGKVDGYYVVDQGDYVYNPRTSVIAPVGPISRNNVGKGVMSPLYTVFRFSAEKTDFYEHYFKSTAWHSYVRSAASTGARHDRMSITTGAFMRMPVPTPDSSEQQKIADCLTSLNKVIAVQGRKVEALKAHKRGLTQQLFPREGETLPRLRLPEFRDGPEWTTHPFEHFIGRSFYGTSSSTSEKGQYPVLRMGNMVDGTLDFSNMAYIDLDRESFDAFRLMRGDILLNRTNSMDLVGKISLFDLDLECITASYIVAHRLDKERLDPSFCNFMLNTPQYQAKIKAFARPSISQANINPTTFRKELNVSVPSLAEQQRIADSLSGLDDQIAAESEKFNALKTHKKGLMQQLFPLPEVSP
ncbi:restriction endonuclease subunit S [Paraburkholderia graminis]|uniref:restriction endonuclease subunit S n=1 Tax=Paraburkholderia graminis TaxID=60548 RepID=UPI002793E98E|nr:restriction endonuclease subunit S [Paraburkholderia graminis]MDQ0621256.1 type I restriction enzyme S subunit [Paraburkholderia graminis]